MENWEQKTLINELLQGLEQAKELQAHLTASSSSSSPEERELLVRSVLASYDKALLILNWNEARGKTPTLGEPGNVLESPLSINGSPWSDNLDEGHQEQNDVTKKRKLLPTWTDQVKINFENGYEGPREDGYSWRKYGKKDILGAKYPRSYYRCTFRNSKHCWATKQVQRSEHDPSVFDITYRGKHTCDLANQSIPAPASPEKQENKQDSHCNNHQLNQSQEASLFNFRANLRVNTDLDNNNNNNNETSSPFPFPSTSFGYTKSENYTFLPSTVDNSQLFGGCSPPFFSPSTPETNFFSIPPCHMKYFGIGGDQNVRNSASDLTEIISANTSATNSPIMNLDFSLDPIEMDPYFPFDSPGFFS